MSSFLDTIKKYSIAELFFPQISLNMNKEAFNTSNLADLGASIGVIIFSLILFQFYIWYYLYNFFTKSGQNYFLMFALFAFCFCFPPIGTITFFIVFFGGEDVKKSLYTQEALG